MVLFYLIDIFAYLNIVILNTQNHFSCKLSKESVGSLPLIIFIMPHKWAVIWGGRSRRVGRQVRIFSSDPLPCRSCTLHLSHELLFLKNKSWEEPRSLWYQVLKLPCSMSKYFSATESWNIAGTGSTRLRGLFVQQQKGRASRSHRLQGIPELRGGCLVPMCNLFLSNRLIFENVFPDAYQFVFASSWIF